MTEPTREETLEFSREIYDRSTEARRVYAKRWSEAWDLYSNNYDWGSKLDWQSKQPFPKLPMAVEMASGLIENALMSTDEPYSIVPEKESDRWKIDFIQPLIQYSLYRNKYKTLFADIAKSGFINSICGNKVYWREYSEERYHFNESAPVFEEPVKLEETLVSEAQIDLLDPMGLYLDDSGRDKVLIHEVEVDWYDLDGDEEYDQSEVHDIYESYVDLERAAQEAVIKKSTTIQAPPYRKTVTICEFWGDLWSKDGKLFMRNARWTTAQGHKYLIKRPEPNPFWHQQSPIVYGSLFRKPFSVYHKALAEDLVGLQRLLTEIVNLIIDGIMYSVVKGFELDMSQILDPEDIKRGMFPGITIKKKGFMQAQAVKEIISSGVPNQALLLLQLLDREFQQGSGITEFMTGMPQRRGRQTAKEISSKTQESYKLLEHISKGLEQQVFTPTIKLLYFLNVQFAHNSTYPGLERFFEKRDWEKFKNMSARERMSALWGQFHFEVTGLSSYASRQQEFQRIQTLLQVASGLGDVVKAMGRSLNMPYLLDRMTTILGFSPGRVWIQPEEVTQPGQNIPPVAQTNGQGQPKPQAKPQGGQPSPEGAGTEEPAGAGVGAPDGSSSPISI